MLYRAAVQPDTFSLLKYLMEMKDLRGFNLAGGTSLALQIGHRISYDLDFFGKTQLSVDEIFRLLYENFPFREIHRTKNILIGVSIT